MTRRRRSPFVVDTNVPIVANHRLNEPIRCAAACAEALNQITKAGVLVIDDRGLILDEYRNYLSYSGKPGAGDVFFKWLVNHRYRPDRVAQVPLPEDQDRPGEFSNFPRDPDLAAFDPSDRKFAAVALAHAEGAPVLNATDSDWWHHRVALQKNGLEIRFLCGEERFRDH